ncbi:MAG: hypothetical protein KKF88_02425 [Alphaproteobacteria bacterium]|nr:hypothetical protein [Alphaproteobacteria bacterium]
MNAALRESPYVAAREDSVRRRMAVAAREPVHLPELLRWFRHEWAQECPAKLHEAGTEPDSALGSPRMAGAFRAYLVGSPMATDHDDRLDVTRAGATRRYPIHAALSVMAHKWPLSARYLFAIAWAGAEWCDVALAWHMLPEIGHRFTQDSLHHLWSIWARDAGGLPNAVL